MLTGRDEENPPSYLRTEVKAAFGWCKGRKEGLAQYHDMMELTRRSNLGYYRIRMCRNCAVLFDSNVEGTGKG